ncbi:MAG TPA: 3'(2'),5'-bisphosphate nucleotidase CysQ [Pyrinomonadaceae bacterium]|jgi:3'(2'), 5'-bisphosphate nucleotidase|nr:3'(2'),5'-bisphosphate nucleotidase CysQ [Pyrinomonadaceae bacterium]
MTFNDKLKFIGHYENELRVAIELAREAGAAILEHYEGPITIEQKHSADDVEPVTQADRIANELIVGRLAREFPGDGILAEESVDTKHRLDKLRVWMVDPLDGTNGFIDGNGDFAVQIGLAEEGECVVGVVYQPLAGVLYRAVIGRGAWVERPDREPEEATVSSKDELAKMRLAASRSHRSPRMGKVVARLGFQEEVQRGSVGIKIGLLVEQQCDVYIHLSPRTKQWDTCAPQLILTEAGGKLSDLFGRPLNYNVDEVQNRNGLVASNGIAHEQIIKTLGPLLDEFGRRPV